MSPVAAVYLVWGVWLIVWLGGATFAKREPASLHGWFAFAFHVTAAAAVFFLLMIVTPLPGTDMQYRLWDRAVPQTTGWGLVVVAVTGFGFAGWASLHRIIRLRHGAVIVKTGLYAIVRHPLYLGLMVAALATALVFGRPTSLLGAVLLAGALAGKALIEERKTDDAPHRAYRKRVPMFVPFWPMRD